MYVGSFAASLKGIACTRGFVIFTRVRVNKHIPPFTGGGFLTLSPSPDFICCVSNCLGNASLSPPWLASNGSIPLRSTTNYLALHGFILQNLHCYSRLSMQWLGMTLQRAAVNQSSRVSIAEWSSQVARLVTKRSLVQIRLPRPNRSPNHCLSGKQKDCEGFPGRKIARLEVRTVSQ